MDVVATSEVSISLTLDPSKIWSRDLIDDELDSLVSSFGEVAKVSHFWRIWACVLRVDMRLVHGLQGFSCGTIEGRLAPGCMMLEALHSSSCNRWL